MIRPIFPIESPQRLAHLLGLTKSEMEGLATRAFELYDPMLLFVNGKEPRPINIPREELRSVQRRILRRLFVEFVPHSRSFGGVKGSSARENAELHLGNPFVLKIDLRKFYPSVHYTWVHQLFQNRFRCSPPVASLLRRLLTLNNGLPQGTCTSPALADQIVKPVDDIFFRVFAKANATYSRFVDDITISGPFRLRRYLPFMSRVFKRLGLQLHSDKVQEFRPGDEVIVTGFSLGKRLGLPSTYISQVKSELEKALAYTNGNGGQMPPYCSETYWGIIEYVGRVDKEAAKSLRRIFSNVKWSMFAQFELPRKKGVLRRIDSNADTEAVIECLGDAADQQKVGRDR